MTSVQNLLSNSTNRFSPVLPTFTSPLQSSFTPLLIQSSDHKSLHFTSSQQSFPSTLLQPITQTYSQLQEKCTQLNQKLLEANKEKQLMTMLFEKVFMMEAGHEERMKKRFRRKKNQIQGKHSCKLCSKMYSSSTSLARHAKLKHSYTMLEPPQHDYQIPPQPNSMNVDSCTQSRPEDTQLNERLHEKKGMLMDENYSQQIEDESQSEDYSSSQSHESTPFQKGLS